MARTSSRIIKESDNACRLDSIKYGTVMHPSAMAFGKEFFDTYTSELESGLVIDIGSQNVNGSLKDVCPTHLTYCGVDFVQAEGVDVILEDPYHLPFDDASADIVVCSSCFEHSEFFWLLFLEILRILKPSGLLYLNVPSNGYVHRYPVDCWRFYPDSGRALVSWAQHNSLTPALLESFIGDMSDSHVPGGDWNDFVAVFLKDAVYSHLFTRRITDNVSGFSNGFRLGDHELRQPQFQNEDQRMAAELKTRLMQTFGSLERAQELLQESQLGEQALHAEINQMRLTWSWRLTLPFRSACKWLKQQTKNKNLV